MFKMLPQMAYTRKRFSLNTSLGQSRGDLLAEGSTGVANSNFSMQWSLMYFSKRGLLPYRIYPKLRVSSTKSRVPE